jgi:hypothetical protein
MYSIKTQILIALLTIVSTFCVNAQTNVYHQFPHDSAVWCETHIIHPNAPLSLDSVITYNYCTKALKDTAINDSVLIYLGTQFFNGNANSTFLYDDTVNHKMFQISDEGIYGKMVYFIYDFNKIVGDTINDVYLIGGGSNVNYGIVSLIDSVFVGNNYRKQINYYFNLIETGGIRFGKIIEGIGSTFGLNTPFANSPYNIDNLDCFNYKNKDTLNITKACDLNEDVPVKLKNGTIQIFPNPAIESINISAQEVPSNIFPLMLKLYNNEGKLCITKSITENNNTETINIEHLPNGIYCWQLLNNKSSFHVTNKIIINH